VIRGNSAPAIYGKSTPDRGDVQKKKVAARRADEKYL
jgi:hypothetical protein